MSVFSFPAPQSSLPASQVSKWLKEKGPAVGLTTFALLFLVNLIWALVDGRALPDSDPLTRNFFEDWPNVLNYALICPLYVTLGLGFLLHIRQLRIDLQKSGLSEALGLKGFATAFPRGSAVVSVGLILGSSTVAISAYMSELPRYQYLFWFQTMSNGVKLLNAHGYYYLITNLLLNLVIVVLVAAHFELFAVASILGRRSLELSEATTDPDPSLVQRGKLVRMLQPFSSLYLVSKILVVILLANLFTWRAQKPEFKGMLEISILLLALLGAAVVSYPRYHLQFCFYRLWQAKAEDDYPDLRTPLAMGVAGIADILILGGAMANLVAYVLEKLGVASPF